MPQAQTRLLFPDWLIQGDSQGIEHLKTLLWWWFLLAKDILRTLCGIHIAHFCPRWYIAIHPLSVQPSASFSHFARKDAILAQWCSRGSALGTVASPGSHFNLDSRKSSSSPAPGPGRGCRWWLSGAGCPGAVGGDPQADWETTDSVF